MGTIHEMPDTSLADRCFSAQMGRLAVHRRKARISDVAKDIAGVIWVALVLFFGFLWVIS